MNILSDILLFSILANVITWAVFGFVVGLISYFLNPRSGGFFLTIITAVLGSMIGGFLASMIFGTRISGIDLQSFIVATSGALILVVIQRMLFNKQT